MADITIKVEGLSKLGERMRSLSSKVNLKIARSATNAAAQVVKKKAKEITKMNPSVRSGSLLESIIVKKLPKSQSAVTSEHAVTFRGRGKGKTNKKTGVKQKEAPHANLVEFGTVNMPAEPILRPALERNIAAATNAMKKKLSDGIDKASK